MDGDQYFAYNPIIPRGNSRRKSGPLADEISVMEEELERTLQSLHATKRSLAIGRIEAVNEGGREKGDRYDRERHSDNKPSPDKVRDILERELSRGREGKDGRELRDSNASNARGGLKGVKASPGKKDSRHISPKPVRSPSPSGKAYSHPASAASPIEVRHDEVGFIFILLLPFLRTLFFILCYYVFFVLCFGHFSHF
jgi:hypothetical protein